MYCTKIVLQNANNLGNALKCWTCPRTEAHLCENIQENGNLVDVDGDEKYCSLTIATYLDGSIVYISRDTVSTEHFEIGCRYQGEYYVRFSLKRSETSRIISIFCVFSDAMCV